MVILHQVTPRSTSFASADSRGTGLDFGGADDGKTAWNACDIIVAAGRVLTICAARCGGLHLQAVGTRCTDPSTMRSYREELWFETKTRRAYLNITRQIESVVKNSGVQEGLVLVNAHAHYRERVHQR